jgi:hypothetical protein
MLTNIQIGKQSNSNGAQPVVRGVREGELLVTENQGRFYQKNAEGDGWAFATPLAGLTLAATHTTATLGATSTPLITIFNGGTYNIAVNREYVATLSGTPGPGSYWWYIATAQSGAALTTLTDVGINAKNFTADVPSGIKLGLGKALTGLVGSMILYKPCGALNTVTATLGVLDHSTDGAIIVPPGQLIALLAPAAGTTHVVHASVDITQVEVSQ